MDAVTLKTSKRKRRRTRNTAETDSGISLSTMSPADSVVGGAGERKKRRRRRKRKTKASKTGASVLGQCLQQKAADDVESDEKKGVAVVTPISMQSPSVESGSGLSSKRFKGLQDVVTIYQSKFAPKATTPTNGVMKKVEQKNLHMENSSSESESSSDDDDDDDEVDESNDGTHHTTHKAPKSQLAHSAYILNNNSPSSSTDNILKPQGLVT